MSKFDFYSQKLISQLEHIYGIEGDGSISTPMSKYDVGGVIFFDLIYDQLIKDGHTISSDNTLWKLSQEAFMISEKRQPTSADTKLLHEYYKSYLAKKHLQSKLPEKIGIYNEETGQRITRITLI